MAHYIIITLFVLSVIGLSASVFLGKEILKKFFMKNDSYKERFQQLVIWNYTGDKRPAMHKVLLKSLSGKPFIAYIGFRLNINGRLWKLVKRLESPSLASTITVECGQAMTDSPCSKHGLARALLNSFSRSVP